MYARQAAARYRTHRTKTHTPSARCPQERPAFWRVREESRAGIAVALSRRVTDRTNAIAKRLDRSTNEAVTRVVGL